MSADRQSRCSGCGATVNGRSGRRSWFCGTVCLLAASRALAATTRDVEEGLRTKAMEPVEAAERLASTAIWTNRFDPAPPGSSEARRTALGTWRVVRRLMPGLRAAEEVTS